MLNHAHILQRAIAADALAAAGGVMNTNKLKLLPYVAPLIAVMNDLNADKIKMPCGTIAGRIGMKSRPRRATARRR